MNFPDGRSVGSGARLSRGTNSQSQAPGKVGVWLFQTLNPALEPALNPLLRFPIKSLPNKAARFRERKVQPRDFGVPRAVRFGLWDRGFICYPVSYDSALLEMRLGMDPEYPTRAQRLMPSLRERY